MLAAHETPRCRSPRRCRSVDALLGGTRVVTIVTVLGLAGGIASDVVGGSFWARHPLVAGLVSSVIIVMSSVAIIDEVLERRRRGRWSVLAQFVMLELVRNARLIWTGVLAQVGLVSPEAAGPDQVEANRLTVRDTTGLTVAVRRVIAYVGTRRRLHEEIALLAAHTDEVLVGGRP
jgi:hypothetical protein